MKACPQPHDLSRIRNKKFHAELVLVDPPNDGRVDDDRIEFFKLK
jgi:hypothetical protein